MSPDGHNENQVDHIAIDKRHVWDKTIVRRSIRSDNFLTKIQIYLVVAKYKQRISNREKVL